jgi:hypothetical protein
MKLEFDEEMRTAFQNKEVNFKELYGNELEEFKNEVKYYLEKGAIDTALKQCGYTLYYVAKQLGYDVGDEFKEDEFLISLGFNTGDTEYITDFAMANIIEDEFKINGDVLVCEMNQKENVIFKGEMGINS